MCYNVPNQLGLCTYHPWIMFILRSDRQGASTDVLREKKQNKGHLNVILKIKLRSNKAKSLNKTYNKGPPVVYATIVKNCRIIVGTGGKYNTKYEDHHSNHYLDSLEGTQTVGQVRYFIHEGIKCVSGYSGLEEMK